MKIVAKVAVLSLLLATILLGQNFRVLKAEYGFENTWLDVTDRVSQLVRGNGVEFRVDGETLTDPMPGVQKTLRIRYVLNGRTRTDNFADLANVRLGNPNAGGGGGGGGNNGGGFGRGLSIVRAEFGVGNRFRDVSRLLNDQIRGGRLRIQVNNDSMGGDPAPANAKTLRVEYRYQGQTRNVTIPENSYLDLPEGGFSGGNGNVGQDFSIVEAVYRSRGRQNAVTDLVRNAIRGNRVNLQVSGQTMGGNSNPGRNSELYVRYLYKGQEYENTTPEGSYLNIPSTSDRPTGSSGGFTGGNTPIFGGNGGNALFIDSATWGSGFRTVDVSGDLRNRIQNGRLNMQVNNASFNVGDPATGADKELIVRYRTGNGPSQTLRIREGSQINIP